MSDTKTEVKSKIRPEIERIASMVEADLFVGEDKVVGLVAKEGEANVFERSLPENVTIEQCRAVGEHIDNFASAAGLAFGRFATEQVAKGVYSEKDGRQYLDVEIPLWDKNNLGISYTKEKVHVGKNPKNPDETITTTKQGDMRIALNMNADANRGQLKHVKNAVNDLAAEAFGAINK